MFFGKQKLILLLLAAHLLVSAIFVEAGLFDDLKRNLSKSKSGRTSDQEEGLRGEETSSSRRIPPRPSRQRVVTKDEDDEEKLAQDLAKMDETSHRNKKPQKLTNMLAKMRDHNNDGSSPEAETEAPEPEPEVKPTSSRIRKPSASSSSSSHNSNNEPATVSHAGRVRRPIAKPLHPEESKHHHLNAIMGSKVMHSSFWKKEIKEAYKTTKDAVKELPTVVKNATDNLSALLKLDNRGRLLALIKEVEEDINFVKKEFSAFSITWSPIMERALSYVGKEKLDKVSMKSSDELDFRPDALTSAAFGFEFMRLMMDWRKSLMFGHQAFKQYLTEVMEQQEKEKFDIDEDYIYQLSMIHNYILLTCWLDLDNSLVEPRMKIEYLSSSMDQMEKNYESIYFRDIVTMQEVYDPTAEEFKNERNSVVEALSEAGQDEDQFKDVDGFLEDYKNQVVEEGSGEIKEGLEWETNGELLKFMEQLEPELRFNSKVYEKSLLKDIKKAKEQAEQE